MASLPFLKSFFVDYSICNSKYDLIRFLSLKGKKHRFICRQIEHRISLQGLATLVKPPLFGLEGLNEPKDFMKIAAQAVYKTEGIRTKLKATPPSDPANILLKLDEISNTVCQVIDVAEFCRSVHSDSSFREASEEAFMHLAEYIQDLNTDTSLYELLVSVTNTPTAFDTLSEEQQRMATLLKAEFERDGIHLSNEMRQQVTTLQNEITRIETTFSQNIISKSGSIQVPKSALSCFTADFLAKIPQPDGQPKGLFTLPTHNHVSSTILKFVQDGAIRRAMYIAANTCTRENVEVLELLVKYRHLLAQTLGFDSYSSRFLSDKMLTSPQEVISFLTQLSKELRPKSEAEMKLLSEAKFKLEGVSEIKPWDLSFYMGKLRSQSLDFDGWTVASYFSIPCCLNGLTLLCEKLFGITLKQVPVSPTESWVCAGDEDKLLKLELHHAEEGFLGTIYLDLHPREGKYTHAAHFTLRCGFKNQLPLVALVCNFSHHNSEAGGERITLLSHSEVETLFHEFGHALHSLLSRTQFHHLAGTRGPVDFVEVPSHLMELFAWDYRVLSLFARHYRTGEPIPAQLVERMKRSKQMFEGIDSQTQILYALLDQKFFGPQPVSGKMPLTQIAASLQKEITSVTHENGTYWHARFGHFTSYGAGYYGYLYSKSLALEIWNTCFEKDPLNRKSGQMLWKELLIHGSARNPFTIIKNVMPKSKTLC